VENLAVVRRFSTFLLPFPPAFFMIGGIVFVYVWVNEKPRSAP